MVKAAADTESHLIGTSIHNVRNPVILITLILTLFLDYSPAVSKPGGSSNNVVQDLGPSSQQMQETFFWPGIEEAMQSYATDTRPHLYSNTDQVFSNSPRETDLRSAKVVRSLLSDGSKIKVLDLLPRTKDEFVRSYGNYSSSDARFSSYVDDIWASQAELSTSHKRIRNPVEALREIRTAQNTGAVFITLAHNEKGTISGLINGSNAVGVKQITKECLARGVVCILLTCNAFQLGRLEEIHWRVMGSDGEIPYVGASKRAADLIVLLSKERRRARAELVKFVEKDLASPPSLKDSVRAMRRESSLFYLQNELDVELERQTMIIFRRLNSMVHQGYDSKTRSWVYTFTVLSGGIMIAGTVCRATDDEFCEDFTRMSIK